MFERLTPEARAVIHEAQEVAIELGADHIGAGHLLYGCALGREATAAVPLHATGVTAESLRSLLPRGDEPPGGEIDPEALRAIGIDFDLVRSAVEHTFGEGALEGAPDRRASGPRIRKPPFSHQAKRSLELSLRVALELHERRIRPGHLLLGLLRLDDDFVSMAVQRAGSSVAGLSAAVLESLDAA